jgi:hypothetical protein
VKTGHCQGLASGIECCTPDLCQRAFGGTSKCIPEASKCPGSEYLGKFCAGATKCCGPKLNTPPLGMRLAVLLVCIDQIVCVYRRVDFNCRGSIDWLGL